MQRALFGSFVLLWGSSLVGCASGAAGPKAQAPTPQPPPERAQCADFELDVQRFWSSETKAQVGAGITNVGGEWTEAVRERVLTKMDNLTRDWVMMQEGICKDTLVRHVMSEEAYTKVSLCLRGALVSQRTIVSTLESASKEHLFNVDAALAKAQEDALACQKEAVYSAYANADAAAQEARDKVAQASTYRELNDERAEEAAQDAQAAAERSASPTVRVDALVEQAWQLDRKGDYLAALRSGEDAREIARSAGYELGVASAEDVMSTAYNDQGEYERARQHGEIVLEIRRRALGESHVDTASAYNNLGIYHEALGEYPQALEMYEKATGIWSQQLGANEPNLATAYNNTGIVYRRLGDFARARELQEKALAMRQRSVGENHPATALSYTSLGWLSSDQGDLIRAQRMFQEALDIRRRVLGESHSATAGAYNNLATAYLKQGKYAEAHELLNKALEGYRTQFGESYPDMAYTYSNLGIIDDAEGDYGDALEMYGKALDIDRRTRGEAHPETASTYNNLGTAYKKQGDYAHAFEMYGKALEVRRRVLGEKHPYTVQTAQNIKNLCDAGYDPACQ